MIALFFTLDGITMDDEKGPARAREEIRKEMDDAEKKFQGYLVKRNEYNDKARQTREDRDLLHTKRKEIMEQVNALRDERSKALDELRKHKEKRDLLHLNAKKLIEIKKARKVAVKGERVAGDLFSLKAHLKKLEYMQQTTPLTMDKEREVIDEIKEGYAQLQVLEKEFSQIVEITDEVKTLDGELDGLFKQADDEHQLVVKYYEISRKYQKKIDEVFREVSHLIAEADRKHASFLELRKKADEFHEKASEMRGLLNDIRKENREQAQAARQVINDQNLSAREAIENQEMLDEKYDEALEHLLKKGKISL